MLDWLNCQNIVNIVLIVVILVLVGSIIYNKFFKKVKGEEFGDASNKLTTKQIDDFKKLKVTMYKKAGCIYCKKQSYAFQNAGVSDFVKVVDVDKNTATKAEFAQYGESGVPLMVSVTTTKTVVGYTSDIAKLIEKLK
jgi:glutaredoxin